MLHREREAARLAVHAHARLLAGEVRQRRVEHLDVDLGDVSPDPFLEDVDQEPAVAVRRHRATADQIAGLDVERPIAPRRPRHLPVLPSLLHPLDHWDELHEPSAALIAQEPVHLATAVLVGRVHRGQHVELDARSAKLSEPAHHLIEAAASAFCDAECVVDLAGAVDRDANQEVVLAQERRPLAVELGAIGLDRVRRPLTRLQVMIDKLNRAAEEVESHQRRLAALPRDLHHRNPRVRFDQLPDVGLEQLVRHPEPASRIQHLLREKEAVGAVEVAHGPSGLREQMKRRRSDRRLADRYVAHSAGLKRR